jgi:streptogramin lyase
LSAPRSAALGCLAICALLWTASASAEPVGLIEEFDVGGWAYSLTPGPDGDVWFSFDRDPVRIGDTAIGRITPQGKTTFFRAGLDRRSGPGVMTLGPDGNLWFGDDGKRPAIGRITPQGTIAEFRAGLDSKSRPGSIVSGPDGNIWFTDVGKSSAIGRVTPSGTITEFRDGLDPKSTPVGLVAGPDGNLWFGDSAKTVGRITTDGTITEFGTGTSPGVGAFGGPVVGPDGNLWIAGGSPLGVARITTLGAISTFTGGPNAQASLLGPLASVGGNLWFTERGGGPGIGRVTPSGEITEFRAGMVYASSPEGIVAGPDAALWFTDRELRSIGRIVPPSAPPNTFIVRPAEPVQGGEGDAGAGRRSRPGNAQPQTDRAALLPQPADANPRRPDGQRQRDVVRQHQPPPRAQRPGAQAAASLRLHRAEGEGHVHAERRNALRRRRADLTLHPRPLSGRVAATQRR